jgi:hypothetical protein
MLTKSHPEDAKELWKMAQHDADVRYRTYEYLAQRKFEVPPATGHAPEPQREIASSAKPATVTVETNK